MNTPPADFRVLVLAAGRGTRMGGPKAIMQVRGEPWWRAQLGSLKSLNLESTWVTSPGVADSLRQSSDRPTDLVLADPHSPMFASIASGIQHLSPRLPKHLFVLPVDSPVPTGQTFLRLAASRSPVAVPVFADTRGHPVRLSREWIERTFASLLRGEEMDPTLRLDRLIEPDSDLVKVDDPRVTTNLNTPDDVRRYEGGLSPGAERFSERESP